VETRFPGASMTYGSAASGAGDNREIPVEEGGDVLKGSGQYVFLFLIFPLFPFSIFRVPLILLAPLLPNRETFSPTPPAHPLLMSPREEERERENQSGSFGVKEEDEEIKKNKLKDITS